MKVGFIGLGTMGAFMATNLPRYLERSNHGLVVHDIRRESPSRSSRRVPPGPIARAARRGLRGRAPVAAGTAGGRRRGARRGSAWSKA